MKGMPRHRLTPRLLLAVALPLMGTAGGFALLAPQFSVGERKVGETGAEGGILVASNQTVTPAGTLQKIGGLRPKALALSPDRKTLAVLAQGRVLLYDTVRPEAPPLAAVPVTTGPVGIAWTPDGTAVYAALAGGKVARLVKENEATWKKEVELTIDTVGAPGEPDVAAGTQGRGPQQGDPQVTGLALGPDGKTLYVALGIRNQVAVVSLPDGKVTRVIPVQAAPYHLALSPDGKTLAVANRGGRIARKDEASAPSAGTAIRVDKKTDAAKAGSVSLVETATFTVAHIETGRQPSGMAFSADNKTLYVASSDDDTVRVLDVARKRSVRTLSLRPADDPGFGQIPTDVAVSSDGRTLYVACGGANAVAVMDISRGRPRGYVPTGWFPIALAERGGALYVASSKGLGSRLSRNLGDTATYAVYSTVGVVQFVASSELNPDRLSAFHAQVARNNRWAGAEPRPRKDRQPVPVPERVGEPSVFEHVVYIIKENQTYDGVLGDLPEGNGDKSLCTFPEEVTPNHHALAREFVVLDNTYTSGTNSADGHQWTVSSVGNGYIEQNYAAHTRSYPYDGGDPLAYSPEGFLWNAAVAAKKSVRVYGEFVNKPKITNRQTGRQGGTWSELWQDYKKGMPTFEITADTDNAALKPLLHPNYIGFPSTVPDQWRADQFIADVDRFEKENKMPHLSILLLPNDHTMGTRPGSPTPRATVADNDLAFGRIVERLTKSKFWPKTLILVIEDDSQLGVDHVDGHRTIAFCLSAYTRRGMVDHQNNNHTSFVRTMGLVLGFPALNRFDRTATPLACFTSTPDLRPYVCKPNRIALDEMNPPAAALKDPEARRLAIASDRLNWSDVDRADAETVSRAVWKAQRPNEPFPTKAFHSFAEEDE